jgi:hypothetical protein
MRGRQVLRLVEHLDLLRQQFHLAGGQARVRIAGALAKRAANGDAVLAAQAACGGHHLGRHVGQIEHHLTQALAVAQIQEHQTLALIAIGVHPSAQRDLVSGMIGARGAAGVGALQHGVLRGGRMVAKGLIAAARLPSIAWS